MVSAKCEWHSLRCRTHAIQPICAICVGWSLSLWPDESETRNQHNQMIWPHDTLKLATLLQEVCALLDKGMINRLYPMTQNKGSTQLISYSRRRTLILPWILPTLNKIQQSDH